MIAFHCAHCGLEFHVKDEFAGRSTRCPGCKHPLVVPQPDRELAETIAPVGALEGAASCLDRAGHHGGVSLEPPGSEERARSVDAALAARPRDGLRYVIQDEIARGGMGAVLRAIDRDLRREVAIKFMLVPSAGEQQDRFVEEAQITGQLEHPNIVPIHELGVDAEQRFFFSMKLVRGRSLADVVKELREHPRQAERAWPLSRLLTILVNVCNAMAYAHSRRVIHRDLKPANIMVGDYGEVYVMDWGLAKVLKEKPAPVVTLGGRFDWGAAALPENGPAGGSGSGKVETDREGAADLTREGAVMGTPAYMPPEQAMGMVQAIDERSDIYALGAILYELLTLLPPIETGGDYLSILIRVAEGQVKPPEERTPDRACQGKIPRELSAVALKALAREPGDRYQSVQEFRRDIELYQEGRAVSAKEDTVREALAKFVRRNKGFSLATGVALVLLTAVTTYFLRVNYAARLHAEEQQEKAERAYKDYELSQQAKEQAVRRSLPAFLRASRQLSNDGKLAEALQQVDLALEYDPNSAAAHLLKGQIFLGRKDWPRAQAEVKLYLAQFPKDAEARGLLELSQGDVKEPAVLFALAEGLQRQKLYGLSANLLADVKAAVANRRPLLELYRKQIEASWPGLGKNLSLAANGEFVLRLQREKQVSDLQPLRRMRLGQLDLAYCPIEDVEPLRGMPLTDLSLCCCSKVTNLEPLRGMPLARLNLNSLRMLSSLGDLRQLPLTSLDLTACAQISDLRPLRGKRLTELKLHGCPNISDLEPLRDMPMQTLWLGGTRVSDLGPLGTMPLQSLDLYGSSTITDLRPLEGVPLQVLNLKDCSGIHDLTPLGAMKLKTITFSPQYVQKGLDVLRRMDSLQSITVDSGSFPADVFWKRYDAGEFRK